MSNAQTNDRSQTGNERSNEQSSAQGEIDIVALAAAVERLMRRDLELERERLQGLRPREVW